MENIVQATARDILCYAMKTLRCCSIVMHIHDELVIDVEGNVKAAQGYSRYAVDNGYIPIAPHLLFPQFLDDDNPKERELGLFFGNALMFYWIWALARRALR